MEASSQKEEIVKHQGFGDALNKPSAEPVVDPMAPAAEPKVEDPGVVTASAKPPVDPATKGMLKGIQAERDKRQAAQRENEQLRQQIAQLTGEQPVVTQPQTQMDPNTERRLLTISESSARAVHPDYDEKFAAFAELAEKNPILYNDVMNSDHPGEAAYTAGKTALIQQKYGTDTDGMIKAIRDEARKDLEAEIRTKVETELRGKIDLKNNQPTNITGSRAAGTGEEQIPPIVGFSQLLAKRQRK